MLAAVKLDQLGATWWAVSAGQTSTLGVLSSLAINKTLAGLTSPWSTDQTRTARPSCFRLLTQAIDIARAACVAAVSSGARPLVGGAASRVRKFWFSSRTFSS